MPVLRPSGSDFTSFVKAAAQYVPAGRSAKVSKSGGVSVALPGLGAIIRTSQVGALASPTTSAVVINGITPPAGGGGPPPPFLPTSIENLTLWLDAADPAGTGTPPSSGTIVTSWVDKSTTKNNFTGSATYALDATYNKYGLIFNGGSYVQANGSLYSITNTTYTIFTVYRFYEYNVGEFVGHIYRSTESYNWFRYQGTSVNWITDTANYITYNGASADALSGIGCINTLTTSSATAYFNGTSVGSGGRGTTTNFAFRVGGEYRGAIFDILIYNRTLTSLQQQKVEGYLAWKWGLQSTLPAGHPFKTAAPTA